MTVAISMMAARATMFSNLNDGPLLYCCVAPNLEEAREHPARPSGLDHDRR